MADGSARFGSYADGLYYQMVKRGYSADTFHQCGLNTEAHLVHKLSPAGDTLRFELLVIVLAGGDSAQYFPSQGQEAGSNRYKLRWRSRRRMRRL